MFEREPIIANMSAAWDALHDVYVSLSDDEWDMASLCPEWTIKGVAAHMHSVEVALSGWVPEGLDTPPPFDKVGPANEALMALPNGEVAAAVRAVYDQRLAELAATDQTVFDTEAMTPVGKATYGRFMAVRVFDAWVHLRDIATPLGRSVDSSGPVAEMALDEVQRTIGYIAGKKIGLGEGQSMKFEVRGGVDRDIYVAVDGRAAEVEHVADPTATVTADNETFMALACGRVDPEEAIAAGRITWSGDDTLGAHAARNLAFTM